MVKSRESGQTAVKKGRQSGQPVREAADLRRTAEKVKKMTEWSKVKKAVKQRSKRASKQSTGAQGGGPAAHRGAKQVKKIKWSKVENAVKQQSKMAVKAVNKRARRRTCGGPLSWSRLAADLQRITEQVKKRTKW